MCQGVGCVREWGVAGSVAWQGVGRDDAHFLNNFKLNQSRDLAAHSAVGLQGMDTDELDQVVSTLDVAKAECLYEEDKKMIIGNIE